jgi:erythromycin esterase-like protein
MRRLTCVALLTVLVTHPAFGSGTEGGGSGEVAGPMSALAQQLCDREIVMLGESRSHASAASIAAKVALARALIADCGFSGVIFESGIYDFVHLDHARTRGTAPKTDLRSAIGGLWGEVAEFGPLLAQLQADADRGRVWAGGMDVQIGSATAHYAIDHLPEDLSAALPAEDADRCRTVITRHHRWEYADDMPFDAAERARLTACIERAATRVATADAAWDIDALPVMVASYIDYLRMLDDIPGARSAGMERNVAWYRSRWPAGTRILIWTATVHAVRPPLDEDTVASLGTRLSGRWGLRVASVGFSAFGGSHGRGGTTTVLDPAPADSLEALALATTDAEIAVLDAAALRAAGVRPSRVLDPAEWRRADWSEMLDAIVVLREERPIAPPEPPPG